jgi:hypothetical protein
MSGRKQLSRPAPRGDWLGRAQLPRGRPWAYAQQLLGGPPGEAERDQSALAQLERQVQDQAQRIAELESKLALMIGAPQASPEEREAPRRTVAVRRHDGAGREYWLAHCEGFQVVSPTGAVGVVQSVRFGSRLDLPDEVEIRAGRLRPLELVVPIAEVEDVEPEKERIRLTSDPRGVHRHVWPHALVPRALRRLDSFVSTLR